MYTVGDTRVIFYGDHPDFDQDPVADVEGATKRWAQWSMRVYKHTATGEHWAVEVGQGKTEMQDDEVYDAPQRVELREAPTKATSVEVTLPTGAGPLADWLDANGYKVAAQAVRGYVLQWLPVEVK
jgi:ribosomal protein S18 acetylase RimI-like enzyme